MTQSHRWEAKDTIPEGSALVVPGFEPSLPSRCRTAIGWAPRTLHHSLHWPWCKRIWHAALVSERTPCWGYPDCPRTQRECHSCPVWMSHSLNWVGFEKCSKLIDPKKWNPLSRDSIEWDSLGLSKISKYFSEKNSASENPLNRDGTERWSRDLSKNNPSVS